MQCEVMRSAWCSFPVDHIMPRWYAVPLSRWPGTASADRFVSGGGNKEKAKNHKAAGACAVLQSEPPVTP